MRLLEVDKWAASEVVLRLAALVGTHPYPLDELLLMAAVFKHHRPELVIDLGTHIGKSARIWHELSREYDVASAIHTVDIFDPSHVEYPGDRAGEFIRGTPVQQHVGDGCKCAAEILSTAREATCLLFLDANHRYESVRAELELCKLVRQGCLLVHDTFFQPGSSYNHGPFLALQDFLEDFGPTQIFHLQTGLPGMSYVGIAPKA